MADRLRTGPSLVALREDLELIDRAIVLLLAERIHTAGMAIRCRSQVDGQVASPAQEARVLARAREWGATLGLSDDLTDTVFRALLEEGKVRFLESVAPHLRPSSSQLGARTRVSVPPSAIPLARARVSAPA